MADGDPISPVESSGDGSSNGSPRKKGNKLAQFFRKNKTITIVLAVGGLYYLIKHGNQESASEGEVEGTGTERGEALSASQGTAELAAFELGRAERRTENAEEAIDEVEEERRREREGNREESEEREESGSGAGGGSGGEGTAPEGNVPGEPTPTPDQHSITIHGKNFAGATGSRIAKSGKTQGGKAYIEYVITFPGRNEHWQYFTASGNWRQVTNPNESGGQNKPPKGQPGQKPPNNPGGSPTLSRSRSRSRKPKPPGIGPGRPVGQPAPQPHPQPAPQPPPSQNHPNAVNTGNRCVNGGVGPHTAPPGYHLFCENGWIMRAPNS